LLIAKTEKDGMQRGWNPNTTTQQATQVGAIS